MYADSTLELGGFLENELNAPLYWPMVNANTNIHLRVLQRVRTDDNTGDTE